MDIGSLRHRVTLQQPEGQTADGYATVTTVWAAVTMPSGAAAEALRFGAPIASNYVKVIMRYRTDIKADWRIVHEDGRVFQISGYGDPDGTRAELHVYCTQVNL